MSLIVLSYFTFLMAMRNGRSRNGRFRMKKFSSLIIVLCLSFSVRAQTGRSSFLKCAIVQIQGNFSSYLPPRVGDQILVNTGLNIVPDLKFDSRNEIPVLKPLKRQPSQAANSNLITYRYEYGTPDGDAISTLLQIAFLSGSQIRGTIQQLIRENHDGVWLMNQAILQCRVN